MCGSPASRIEALRRGGGGALRAGSAPGTHAEPNAAADAAKLLFGLYSEKASKPMEELQGFLQERLALGGAASDVRMVQDERFNETCSTLETLSNESRQDARKHDVLCDGTAGRPGGRSPVRARWQVATR